MNKTTATRPRINWIGEPLRETQNGDIITNQGVISREDAGDALTKALVSQHMGKLGRRGGKKTSKKKAEASRKSLKKARQARWPKKATAK